MHIAVVTGKFPTVSQTFVLNQVTGFIDAGHEVTILASPPDDDETIHPAVKEYNLGRKTHYWRGRYSELEAGPDGLIDAVRTAGGRKLLGAMRKAPRVATESGLKWDKDMVEKAARVASTPKFDVILCHFGKFGRQCQMLREVGLLQGPLATVFHGYDMSLYLREEGEDVYERLLEKGELHLPISEHWRQRLLELGAPPSRTTVHHMGVDPQRFAFAEREPGDDGRCQVLSIARLVEKKGIRYGIQAFAKASRDFPNARYTIIGDGVLRDELEELCRSVEVEDKVEFRGWQNRDEVQEALADHQILLTPSVTAENGDKEGIPVVLMEGMATGIAVVSTRHSGIPELVRHNESGLLADERDVDGLTDHLNTLFADPSLWPAYGRRGRAIVEDEFAVDRLNDILLTLLEDRFGAR